MEISLGTIAENVNGRLVGDPELLIRGVAPFDAALSDQITFADSSQYLEQLHHTDAGAVLVPENVETAGRNAILVKYPKVAFAQIMNMFHRSRRAIEGIHPSAVIGASSAYGAEVAVGPSAVIGNDARIGHRAVIHAGVVIGDRVTIGDDVTLFPNVTIYDGCDIGHRTIIHAGSVIGSDGYGYASDGTRHHKIPQIGVVRIGDDVEIGAANTIDRATFGRTWIGNGVKTDNLVHIAHNVSIGDHTLIIAHAFIAGSVTIGAHVLIGGGATIADHLTIGNHCVIGPMAGVTKSLPDGQIVLGAPEMPYRQFLKTSRVLPHLPDMRKQIHALDKRLKKLEP